MAVTGNFGSERITLENAAEEATLRDILDVMTSATKSGGKLDPDATRKMAEATKGAKDSVLAMLSAANRSEDSLDKLSESQDDARKVINSLTSTIHTAAGNILKSFGSKDISSATQGVISGMNDFADNALSGAQKMLKNPVADVAIEGAKLAIKGTLGVFAMVEGAVAGFKDQFDELANVGFIAGEGIGAFSKTLSQANVTSAEFENLVKNNGEALRNLGGSVTMGARQVVKLRAAMRGQEEQFLRLGYNYEELSPLLADYGSMLERGTGRMMLSDQELIDQTAKYATNLRLLSDLTGKSADQLKAESEEAARSARNQSYLMELESSGRSGASRAFGDISSTLKTIAPGYEKLFEDYNTRFGTAMSKQTGILEQANPALAGVLKNMREGIRNGTITPANAREMLVNAIKANQAGIQEGMKNTAFLAESNVQGLEGVGDMVVEMNKLFSAPVEDMIKNLDKQKNTQDEITVAMVNFKNAAQNFANIQNQVAQTLATKFGPELTAAVDIAIKKLREFGEATVLGAKTNADYLKDYESLMSSMNMQSGQTVRPSAAGGGSKSARMPTAAQKQNEALYETLGELSDKQLEERGWKKSGNWLTGTSFQKMATGGIIPNMGPEGMPIRAGDGVTEAIVPLPNGRSIPVDMRDSQAFKDMNSKLDLVASINRAMLNAMEENNRLVKLGNNLVS